MDAEYQNAMIRQVSTQYKWHLNLFPSGMNSQLAFHQHSIFVWVEEPSHHFFIFPQLILKEIEVFRELIELVWLCCFCVVSCCSRFIFVIGINLRTSRSCLSQNKNLIQSRLPSSLRIYPM